MYRTIEYTCELSEPLTRTQLGAVTFSGDENALRVAVTVTENGTVVPLTGAVIGAWMLREDGTTLRFAGEAGAAGCEAVLPAEACAVTGRFSLLIRMTDSAGSRTLFWGEGTVVPSLSSAVMTAGEPLPDLDTLLARLSEVAAATSRANTAAEAAEAVTALWESALSGAAEDIRRQTAFALAGKMDSTEEGNRAWLWEQGGLHSGTGRNLPDTHGLHGKRVRTVTYLPLERVAGVAGRGESLWVAYFYNSAHTFLGSWPVEGGYTSGAGLKSEWLAAWPEAVYFRLLRRDETSADNPITPEDCWDDLSILCEKQPLPDPTEWEEVPVGAAVQGRRQRDTTDYDEGEGDALYHYRVTQQSVTALPLGERTELYWLLPPWTVVAWKEGVNANYLSASSAWHAGGEPVAVGAGMCYFRAVFARISMDSEHAVIPIHVGDERGCRLFVRRLPSVAGSDPEALRLLDSFRRRSGSLTAEALPVIAHTSDLHGDEARFRRFADFCDQAGAKLMAVTGDICARSPHQGFSFCHDVIRAHRTPAALCVGNHDCNRTGMTDGEVYEALMAPVAEEIGNGTGKTWYLRDLADCSLRVIALNTFQCGAGSLMKNHLSSGQLAWFCGALAGTPDGWGILVLQHSPFGAALRAEEGAEAFFGTSVIGDSHASEQGGTPIYDIVDAYISRERISRSWTQGGDEPVISADADFSACGGEFIAHLTGHLHIDKVCPVPGTRCRQLLLGVTCCTSVRGPAAYPYLSNCDDLGRRTASPSQDAFNLYVIDRQARRVRVIRAGQDITRTGEKRREMEIAY